MLENSKDFKCDKCKDNGFIQHNENGYIVYSKCECYIREMHNRRLRFANLPEALKQARLKEIHMNTWQQPESKEYLTMAFKSIKMYLNNFEQMQSEGLGLYIYSQTKGSGKTHMAACIANELIEKGHQVKFATSGSIMNEIRSTYNDNSEYTENKLLDALFNTEILIIDDFGQEKITDWVNDKFYSIINSRYLAKKVTIYTSNESVKSLEYDERITSRLMERVYEIHYAEESVREHIAASNIEKLKEMLQG